MMKRWYPWGTDVEEPVLTDEDRLLWTQLQKTCRAHRRTNLFKRSVGSAIKAASEALEAHPGMTLGFSCGKDSTALLALASQCGLKHAHIICSDANMHLRWRKYCALLADISGVTIDEWWPEEFSAKDYIETHGLHPLASICTDSDPLARYGFFDVSKAAHERLGRPGLMLGLRAEESKGRLLNRKSRGRLYRHKVFGTVSTPLADLTWLDVYTYLQACDIMPFHPYLCLRLKNDPVRSRTDGWIPGSWSADGQGIALRLFYPSLFERWRQLVGQHVAAWG